MASCAYCNTRILFGGKRDGELRYCNEKCQHQGRLSEAANQLSPADVKAHIFRVHRGNCPKCDGPGPVDVHTSYRVYSVVMMTSWSSRPLVACARCGTKQKIGDTVFSLFLGWWGLPWGILMTPVQLTRNLIAFGKTPDPETPSPALEQVLRSHLAAQLIANQQQAALSQSSQPGNR